MKKFVIQIVLCILLIFALFSNLYIYKTNNVLFALFCLIIFLGGSLIINGYRRPKKRGTDDVMLIVAGLSVLLIALFYMIGMKSGFTISYNSIFKNYIGKDVFIKIFVIVLLTEFSRYIVSQMTFREKFQKWILDGLLFLCFFLVDLTIVTKNYDYTIFSQFYEFIALVLVQSVAKNLLLNYMSRDFGSAPCLLYRLIMDLYVFFLPVIPKINLFIESTILLIFPYILYIVINKLTKERTIEPAKQKEKVMDKILTTISTLIFIVLVALVSREFSYCMIAIGSESMTGTANKGDAIIYEVYDKKEMKLSVDDILVFKKNNVTVVHRINEIISMDGEDYYKTKGDANESVDNWIVAKDDVIGIVKERVPYIGWPSVWLNELF